AFAGGVGLDVTLPVGGDGLRQQLGALFAEELGVVLQVADGGVEQARSVLARHGLGALTHDLGRSTSGRRVRVRAGDLVLDEPVRELAQAWDEVSWRIAALRDNPACADEEHTLVGSDDDPGLHLSTTCDAGEDVAAPYVSRGARPVVAVLREQGVNSHVETAFAFDRAGFDTYDVHMTDLQSGRFDLADAVGL